MVAHSPLTAWLYRVTNVAGASRVIGAAELTIAVLLLLRPCLGAAVSRSR